MQSITSSGFLMLSSFSTIVHIAATFDLFSFWSEFPEDCTGIRKNSIAILFGALCSVFSAFLIAQVSLVIYHFGVNHIPRDAISVSAIVTSVSSAIITGAALATLFLLHSDSVVACSSAPTSPIILLLFIMIMINVLLSASILYYLKHPHYKYLS